MNVAPLNPERVKIDRRGDECRIMVDQHDHMTLTMLHAAWRPDPQVRFGSHSGIDVVDANGEVLAHLPWCFCYPMED